MIMATEAHAGAGVVLASASAPRRAMLENAGVAVTADPASVDEDEVKRAFKGRRCRSRRHAPRRLAEMKGAPGRGAAFRTVLVIGADQMLVCGDVWFDKPPDRDHAAGPAACPARRTHELDRELRGVRRGRPGVASYRPGPVDRPGVQRRIPRRVSRPCRRRGRSPLVGGYQLEGPRRAAVQPGRRATTSLVLGLPLLPLLGYLRTRGSADRMTEGEAIAAEAPARAAPGRRRDGLAGRAHSRSPRLARALAGALWHRRCLCSRWRCRRRAWRRRSCALPQFGFRGCKRHRPAQGGGAGRAWTRSIRPAKRIGAVQYRRRRA